MLLFLVKGVSDVLAGRVKQDIVKGFGGHDRVPRRHRVFCTRQGVLCAFPSSVALMGMPSCACWVVQVIVKPGEEVVLAGGRISWARSRQFSPFFGWTNAFFR